VGHVGEESETFVASAVTDLECELQQGEPGAIAVKLGMLLQAAVLEKKSIQLLTDIYSTSNPLDVEKGNCSLCMKFVENKIRQSVRHFCECTIAAKTVVDASLSVGRVLATKENEKAAFSAVIMIKILFLSEEDELCAATYLVTPVCECPDTDQRATFGKCVPVGELLAVPVTGGIEVRFEVEFSVLSVMDESIGFVNRVVVLPAPEGEEERPSVILRKVAKGERLWDIAKFYQSTIEEIKNANGLEAEGASEGMMLLIPRRR